MQKYKHPIINIMLELPYTVFGKDGELEVYNDIPEEKMKILLEFAKINEIELRFIIRDIICSHCGNKLHRNGTSTLFLNKNYYVKTQNYCHKKCKTSRYTRLYKYKDKYCNYLNYIRNDGLNSDFIDYKSYYSKQGHLYRFYKIKIPVSTIYYHDKTSFEKYYEKILKLQEEAMAKLGIGPSGVYAYDEQYIFINKILYMRMTLIDINTKIIIAEQLVCFEDFDDSIIKNFLKENLEGLPLKTIVTDGRTSYNNIIESIGAIHHRCLFHLMQNLMTPLQRKLNQLNKDINNNEKKIKTNEQKIEEINKIYKGKTGRPKKTDTQRNKDNQEKNKLIETNKKLNNKNKEKTDEINELKYNKERIQKIFIQKNKKDARRRFNTIYNTKEHLPPIIQRFIERMRKNLEILINHIEDDEIPATNNTVENYYRTTLPRKQKRIYRTIEGAYKRIKEQQLQWTHRIVLNQKDKPLNQKTTYTHLKPQPQTTPMTIYHKNNYITCIN